MKKFWLFLILFSICGISLGQTVRYVDINNATPVSPYTNGWASAATSITQALIGAVSGNIILVTNGVYTHTGRLSFTNVALKSVNGYSVTEINGVLNLAATNSIVDGFSFKRQSGTNDTGGWVIVSLGIVTNCHFLNNTNLSSSATMAGCISGGSVYNSVFIANAVPFATQSSSGAASPACLRLVTAYNCWFERNISNYRCVVANNGILYNCIFYDHSSTQFGVSKCLTKNSDTYNSIVIKADFSQNGKPFAFGTHRNATVIGSNIPEASRSPGANTLDYNSFYAYNYITTSLPTTNAFCGPYNATNRNGRLLNLVDSAFYESITNWNASNTGTNFVLGPNGIAGLMPINASSPVVDWGNKATLSTNIGSRIDFLQNTRIYGRSVDAGAYEYFETPVTLPYGDWEPLYGAMDKHFANKEFDVNTLNISNLPTTTNSLVEGDVWWNGTNLLVKLFNPTMISGLRSYFNMDEFTSYTNGQLVSTWTDLSGNSLNATQTVDTNKPVYADGWLDFANSASSGKWLLWDSGTSFSTHTLFVLLSTPYSLATTGDVNYLTIRVSSSNNIGNISMNGNASVNWANEHFTWYGIDAAPSGVGYTSTTQNVIGSGSAVWTFEQPQATNLFVRYNNATPTSPLGRSQPAITSGREIRKYERIGGRYDVPSNFKVKAWIMYDRLLTDEEQTKVYNWMLTQ